MRPVRSPTPPPNKDSNDTDLPNDKLSAGEEMEHGKGLQRYLAIDLLLHHRRYQIVTVGVTWLFLGFLLPVYYLVPYATSTGMAESKAALLVSLIGFINIFVRPLAGLVSQQKILSGHLMYLFSGSATLNGLSNLISAASSSFPSLIVYCILYGVSMGFIAALIFQVLMDTVGMKRFPGAFGLFTILQSITILLGPPLAGLLVDITGQYGLAFYVSCIAVTSSGIFMGLATYAVNRKDVAKKCETNKADAISSDDTNYCPTLEVL